jgi:hypothetical protein
MLRISKNITWALGFFLLLPFLSAGRLSVNASVVINEILPKTDDVTQQWIELYNNGPESVSLNLWALQNTNGTSKTYNMGALMISGRGFLLFPQTQTGITFDMGGDTVRLTDDKNTPVDTQSYQGTLGYYTSMGRTVDGGGVWAVCTDKTPGQTNTCPVPTATPSPTPGPTNTPTPLPLPAVPTDTPADLLPTLASSPVTDLLGVAYAPGPKPSPTIKDENNIQFEIPNRISVSKKLLIQISVITGAWIVLAGIAFIHTRLKKRRRVSQMPPQVPPVV